MQQIKKPPEGSVNEGSRPLSRGPGQGAVQVLKHAAATALRRGPGATENATASSAAGNPFVFGGNLECRAAPNSLVTQA